MKFKKKNTYGSQFSAWTVPHICPSAIVLANGPCNQAGSRKTVKSYMDVYHTVLAQ